jgi:DNA helicase-2/ATP-dependent DNA helicase PcrA
MHDDIVNQEQALLRRVIRLLHEVPYELPPSERELLAELVRIREELAHAKIEDKPALMSQYDQQHALLAQLRAARDKPTVDPASPYFAHLRIEERGEARDLCLGKATRIDHGLRIVDWRNAPISKIFYSYQQGDQFEEHFGDRVMEGKLLARRTVTIHGGALQRIDSPEGTFTLDDGAWTHTVRERPRLAGGSGSSITRLHPIEGGQERRLGTDSHGRRQRADKRLPDIAGLIDPEQFELITRPSTGFLVIRGTAGSGKTTVALHRIAYLAYQDPQIDSPSTLFLVFSRALRDYVSRVLPALGIGQVRPATFPGWAQEQRRAHFPQLPRVYRDDTPEVVLRLKTHPVTMIALDRQREAVDGSANAEQALDDWASVLTQPDVITRAFQELAPEAFTEAELRRALEYNRDRHDELLAWLDGDKKVEATLDPEDDALLLRAWQVRVGPLVNRGRGPLRYKHIAVDEVQDFSPVEIRVLLDTLDEKKSITLAGDTQQHVMSEAGFTSWSQFFSWLGVPGTAVETLRVAYRSAEPIVTFATRLLGDLREDDEVPLTVRSGPPVEFFAFTDHGAAVGFLADALKVLVRDEPLASVALVTPNAGLSAMYYDGLRRADVPHLSRVVDEEFSFSPGVEIVEARAVKGLEFDYVVIIDASAMSYPDLPAARRLLHVAATRAIHQLWVTTVGTPSPILDGMLTT